MPKSKSLQGYRREVGVALEDAFLRKACLLYTSDAADEVSPV